MPDSEVKAGFLNQLAEPPWWLNVIVSEGDEVPS